MKSRRRAQVVILGLAAPFALSIGARAQEATPATASGATAVPPMGTEVAWLVELSVNPGEEETARAVMEDMVASAQAEAGTLSYAWYMSEDGKSVAIYERYADDAAVLLHQAKFASHFKDRFTEAMTITRFTVFGEPGEAVRATVAANNPTYLQPFGGFSMR